MNNTGTRRKGRMAVPVWLVKRAAPWLLLLWAAGWIGSNVVGERLYQAELDKLELGPGSIGSPADGSVPEVTSLKEMESNDRFVLVNQETIDQNSWESIIGGKIGDTYYDKITLEDGSVLAAKTNYEAETSQTLWDPSNEDFTNQEVAIVVTYPIGTLRPWPEGAQEDAAAADWLTYRGGYLDMLGDQDAPLPSRAEICSHAGMQAMKLILVLEIAGLFLWRKLIQRPSVPKNDIERWILGTYAIWAKFFGQFNSRGSMLLLRYPPLIGGRPMDRGSRKITREVLADDWDIKSREDLLDTVEYMSEGPGFEDCCSKNDLAWELCRSTQLLGMGYIAGWLTREEMTERSCVVAQIIQEEFDSWEDLCQNYLEAFTYWAQQEDLPQGMINNRWNIYEEIKKLKNSPYQLPWDFCLAACGHGQKLF